jgi:antitoxin component YwqK of YwqJK toxin-antitoxin module
MKDGQNHGHCRQWFETGQLKVNAYFENGQIVGHSQHYSEDGKLTVENWNIDNKAISKSYHPNGQLYNYQENFSDGSVSKIWNENGKLIYKQRYVNGFPIGCEAEETMTGPINETCVYKGQYVFLKNGIYVDSTGNSIKFTNSYFITEYYDSGKKKSKSVFKKGKGIVKRWDELGTLVEKEKTTPNTSYAK